MSEEPEDILHPRWPHLENLERIMVESPEWLDPTATWVITEKIHGFNARFGCTPDGLPWVGLHNSVLYESEPETWPRDAAQGFVGYAADHVIPGFGGVTIFGEWAGKGIQKGIDYGDKDFYVFGMMESDGALIEWSKVQYAARLLEMNTVPVVHEGKLPSLGALTEMRAAKSMIAETGREGICLTPMPYRRDSWGHYLIGKFKAPEFSELSHARKQIPPEEMPDLTVLQNFVAEYANSERLEHVLALVEEAKDAGRNEFLINPLDIEYTGDVLRTMYQDVVREAGAEYEALSDVDKKMLGKFLNTTTKRLLDEARLARAFGKPL